MKPRYEVYEVQAQNLRAKKSSHEVREKEKNHDLQKARGLLK